MQIRIVSHAVLLGLGLASRFPLPLRDYAGGTPIHAHLGKAIYEQPINVLSLRRHSWTQRRSLQQPRGRPFDLQVCRAFGSIGILAQPWRTMSVLDLFLRACGKQVIHVNNILIVVIGPTIKLHLDVVPAVLLVHLLLILLVHTVEHVLEIV